MYALLRDSVHKLLATLQESDEESNSDQKKHSTIAWGKEDVVKSGESIANNIKVIFLDVDGVLNSKQDGNSLQLRTDLHLQLLREIIASTGAKIVLSSSWRAGFAKARNTLSNRLREYGLEIMDSTPVLPGLTCRGDEIRQWLNDSGQSVERFVILDDDDDMAEFTDTNLVQTDPEIGLQEKDAVKSIELLNLE
ncbi:HAD domain-containing protein [Selenomonas sp. KH1T6]|uniref:HAD domain-containing protein n=1 Tax=Selenomonas sp. KH1T6 TaxID=3158784 RepID=UPI0008A7E55F|nr:hypothetical protein SAMN05216583_1515 [Selenomonas ruminantium]